MNEIRITAVTDNRIAVVSPYNDTFVKRAKLVSGQWDPIRRAWVFPVEVEQDVRGLLRDIYGHDGTPVETVRLRVTYDAQIDTGNTGCVVVGGREVARAYGRDSGARLGSDVVLRKGWFRSGGSRKNWCIVIGEGTEFDLLRLPAPIAHRLEEEHPELCQIIPADGSDVVLPSG